MPRNRANRNLSKWVADFETTTNASDCRVWLWAITNIDNTSILDIGYDIESFIVRVSKMNSHVYFHNLGFDGYFLLDWLFRNGYTHTMETPMKGEFSTLISNMGKFYSITVRWKNGTMTEFRDSLKKIPMSVSAVAKAFKLEEVKGTLDYHSFRAVGHRATAEEIEYITNDVVIVAKALAEQFSEGMTKLTVGSDSLAEYKRLISGKMFERLFPVLPATVDADIRRAYRGGYTYADKRFKGKIVGPGRVYDVNSLYPAVMYDCVLPYGEPEWVDDWPEVTEEYPLFIASVTFTAKIKKDHIPCIQIKGSPHFVSTVYQEKFTEPVTMFCTNVDLALWEDHYDLDILSFNGAYRFKGSKGFFTEFIDKWSEIKANSDGGKRAIAKLHLNSLYGKFATNPNVTPKIPVLDDNVVRLVMGEEETRDPVYTPMGVFITAYARDKTIRAAQAHYDIFAYADTDSLHLLTDTDPDDLDIHPSRLGAWKYEMSFEEAIFARAKCYTEKDHDGVYHTHIAGLPASVAQGVRFEHYLEGAVFEGKLTPKRVPGGVVLEDVGFRLTL